MAVILPFEKTIYEQANVPVSFVGHPLVEKIALIEDTLTQRKALDLPLKAKIIALLPGSRMHEIEQHMPILRDTALLLHQQYPELHFVLPIAGTINAKDIDPYFSNSRLPITLVQGAALSCMAAADFVIVASGTASLECALLEKPMCIIYKSSFLTYLVAVKLIKVRFLGLCNLLANKMIVPEFLQYDCNAPVLAQYFANFHNDKEQPARMIAQLSTLKESLSLNKADCSLFDLVTREMLEINASF